MEEKIWVCLTWPAITARVTPAAWKVSMRRESSPSDIQWTQDGRVGGGAGIDCWVGLLPDGGDNYREAVRARGVEQQEREVPAAGYEA